MEKATQCNRMLAYMREHGSITNRQAFVGLGINSPTRRITDLKRQGYHIEREMREVGSGRKRIAEYRLVENDG